MEAVLNRLRDQSADPEVKKVCSLLLFFLHNSLNSMFNLNQNAFNRRLQNANSPQNRLPARYIQKNVVLSIQADILETLQRLERKYPPAILEQILRPAISEFASKEGDKSFEYRIVKFKLFISMFTNPDVEFTPDEAIQILQNITISTRLLTYWKDWQSLIPRGDKPRNVEIARQYDTIVAEYKLNQYPFILFLVNLYRLDAETSQEAAVEKLASRLETVSKNSGNINIPLLRFILLKFLPQAEVSIILDHIHIEKITDSAYYECSPEEIQTFDCANGKVLRLCPEARQDLKPDDLEFYCKNVGGARKTRKRHRRKPRKTRGKRRTVLC
jgi:hypothetical protein